MKYNTVEWLNRYFSFILYGLVFLLGIAFIFLTKESPMGIFLCILTLGGSVNNYLYLKRNKKDV